MMGYLREQWPGHPARRRNRPAGASPLAGRPAEVAPGVYLLIAGPGVLAANVYFVRSGVSWVLVDAAWPHQEELIAAAAETLFGPGTRPGAILATHLHPDHTGSAPALARRWQVAVYAHPAEMPMARGEYVPEYASPLDRWLLGPLLRLLPAPARHRLAAAASLQEVIRPLADDGSVPGLPGWRWVPAPGHTPGHVAFFRAGDGVLLTGDAVLTVNLNSLSDLLRRRHTAAGPPWITTWDWPAARDSAARLAELGPQVLAPGHGRPMTGPTTAAVLRTLAGRLAPGASSQPRSAQPRSAQPRSAQPRSAQTDGRPDPGGRFLRPVDYSQRIRYRRPPAGYRRLQWLAPLAVRLGASPQDVVSLEVPGRRTGLIRRTAVVRAACGGEHYLVGLAGESEWVRNVRAAGGQVVLGRRHRYAAMLTEVPPAERAPVIRAYLLRGGRRPGSAAAAREARAYFGLGADPSLPDIAEITRYYPVFRITGHRPAAAAGASPGPAGQAGGGRQVPQPRRQGHDRRDIQHTRP